MPMYTRYPLDPLHQIQRKDGCHRPAQAAEEIEPSANAGEDENACGRGEARREVANRVADIGAQGKMSATNSQR